MRTLMLEDWPELDLLSMSHPGGRGVRIAPSFLFPLLSLGGRQVHAAGAGRIQGDPGK